MAEWLDGAGASEQPRYAHNIWTTNQNKIGLELHAEYAREVFGRPEARIQFHSQLGQAMLRTAWAHGGYIGNLEFFTQWIYDGISTRILAERCRQPGNHNSHHMKQICSAGFDFTTPVGFRTFGLLVLPKLRHPSTCIVWTSPGKQGPTQLPRRICFGKTGRRWRSSSSSPGARRSRKRKAQRPHRLLMSSRSWEAALLHCLLIQCPQLPCWRMALRDMSVQLAHLRAQSWEHRTWRAQGSSASTAAPKQGTLAETEDPVNSDEKPTKARTA